MRVASRLTRLAGRALSSAETFLCCDLVGDDSAAELLERFRMVGASLLIIP